MTAVETSMGADQEVAQAADRASLVERVAEAVGSSRTVNIAAQALGLYHEGDVRLVMSEHVPGATHNNLTVPMPDDVRG